MIFRISSISCLDGSSIVTSFEGTSVREGLVTFSLPRVLIVGLAAGIQTDFVVIVGGEISGEKTLHVLLTLLVPTMFVISGALFSIIHGSCLMP